MSYNGTVTLIAPEVYDSQAKPIGPSNSPVSPHVECLPPFLGRAFPPCRHSSSITPVSPSLTLVDHAFGRRNRLAAPPGVRSQGVGRCGHGSPLRQNHAAGDLLGRRPLLLDIHRRATPFQATGNYQGSSRGTSVSITIVRDRLAPGLESSSPRLRR